MGWRERGVALALLLLTLVSCTLAGSVFAYGYFEETPTSWWTAFTSPRHLGLGLLLYGAPLLAILGIHELAHYVVLRRLGLARGLPWFIPFPPPVGFTGTLGAVIDLRDRIDDRSALVRVAAAGPLAGLVVAVGVLLVGLAISQGAPVTPDAADRGVDIHTPLLYDWLARAMGVPDDAAVHPLAVAGWLGLFLTSLQLLPAGQLDGGHLARAYLGRAARGLGWAVVVGLVVLGVATGFYAWIVFAGIAAITMWGQPHEGAQGTIAWREASLGVACLLAFAVTFVPAPFSL